MKSRFQWFFTSRSYAFTLKLCSCIQRFEDQVTSTSFSARSARISCLKKNVLWGRRDHRDGHPTETETTPVEVFKRPLVGGRTKETVTQKEDLLNWDF